MATGVTSPTLASTRLGNWCAILLSFLLITQTANAQSGTVTSPITISTVSIQAYTPADQLITNPSLVVDSTLNYTWPTLSTPAPATLEPLSLNGGVPIFQTQPDPSPCGGTPPAGKPANAIVQDCLGGRSNFEFNMVQSWLTFHNMPSTDESLIYQYGRRDLRDQLRGFMLSYIDGVISNNGSSDIQTYQWMQSLIYPKELNEYNTAAQEYNRFDNNKCGFALFSKPASALQISWSSFGYCDPNVINTFSPPQPPPADYFTEYGREQAYDALITQYTDDPTYLAQSETQAGNYTNYLIGFAAGAPTAAAAGALEWAYWKTIAPYSERLYGPTDISGSAGANSAGTGAGNTVADETAPAVGDAVEESLDLCDVLTAADFVSGVGIILLAVQIAVTAGLQLQAENQNLNAIAAFLTRDQVLQQNQPVDLNALFASDPGAGNKFAEAFIATTLPDNPSTQALPDPDPNARFYVTYYGSAGNNAVNANREIHASITGQQSVPTTSAIQGYFDYLSTSAVNPEVFEANAGYFGLGRYSPSFPEVNLLAQGLLPTVAEIHSYDDHWFLETGTDSVTQWLCNLTPDSRFSNICPSTSTQINHFTPQLAYFDWPTGIRYTADRLDNGRFLVAKDPADVQPTDVPCLADSTGVSQPPFLNCSAYTTKILSLPYTPDDLSVVKPGYYGIQQMTVQVATPPQLVGPDTWIFPVGTLSNLYLSVDGQSRGLPCTVSADPSTLPSGISLANSSFTGTATGPDGEYDVNVTATCAGVSSQHTYKLLVQTPAAVTASARTSSVRTKKTAAASGPQYRATFMWPTNSSTVNLTRYKETEFEILTGGPVSGFTVGKNALPCGLTLVNLATGDASSPQAYVYGWPTSDRPCTAGADNQVTAFGVNGNDAITLSVNLKEPILPKLAHSKSLTWYQGRQNVYFIDGSASEVSLQYNFSNLPSWVTVKNNGANITELIGTPPVSTPDESFETQYQLAINAGNSGVFPHGTPHTLKVKVLPTSELLQEKSPLLFQTGVEGSGEIVAATQTSQPALPGTFSLRNSDLPTGLSANVIDADSLSISGIPEPKSGGIYHVPLQFTDANGQVTSGRAPLMVTQPADLSQLPNLAIAWVGVPFKYTIAPNAGFPTAKMMSPGAGLPDSPGTLLSLGSDSTALAANGLTVINHPGLLTIAGIPTNAGQTYDLGVTAQTYINSAQPQAVGAAAKAPFTLHVTVAGDVNLDGVGNCEDLEFVKRYYGTVRGTAGYNVQADVNNDGVVDGKDFDLVKSHLPRETHCECRRDR